MATRIYVRSEGTPDVTPTSWNFANQINPVSLPGTLIKNSGSAMTSKTEATGTTNPTARAMGRTIIGPLTGQTITGTVKGQMRGSENNAGANATLALAVKVIKPDGTDRGVLLAQTASDSATAGNELATSLTNATFKDASENAAINLTSTAATDGDYLVIEWGFRSATATSRNISLSYGNDSATDLPEDTTTTAANNPWFEFSATISIVRSTAGASAGVSTSSVTGSSTVQAVGSAAGTTGGLGVATAISFAAGSADGVAASIVLGATVSASGGISAGIGSPSAIGNATTAASGQANGLSTVAGTLAATSSTISATSGSAALNGVGAAQVEATGSSAGTSNVSGLSIAFNGAAGTSEGLASSSVISIAIVEGIVSSSAASSVLAVGSQLNWTVGTSNGSALAEGYYAPVGSLATASGVALPLAVGTSAISVTGSSAGVSTVLGVLLTFPRDEKNIPSENRTIAVSEESRIISVPSIALVEISPETRVVTIPAEDRTA